jgi:hypothetical protein
MYNMGRFFMIKILEHRAGWTDSLANFANKSLQNTEVGFRNSFSRGNGVETDLRDFGGKIMISHDMPKGSELTFEDVLQIYKEYPSSGTLGLNIKADGLQKPVKMLLDKYEVEDYFCFDMSVPDAIVCINSGRKVYIRESEYEIEPKKASPFYYKNAVGVWLDQFTANGISYDSLARHVDNGKTVCIVSPELHPWGREITNPLYLQEWGKYRSWLGKVDGSKIQLCTDFPEDAAKALLYRPLPP